jgi:transcriptional regulator with XRE-family HTH domain
MRVISNADELINEFELLRAEKGLTMRTLSEAAGLSRGTYWHWHRTRRTPNINTVLRLAKVLGVRILMTPETPDP